MIARSVLALLTVTLLLLSFATSAPAFAAPEAQAVCAQTYTVAAGDTLANIALNLLGGREGYNLIADATNAAHAADPSYALIPDVNRIEVGWKLCIPERVNGVQVKTESGTVEAFDINGIVSFKGIPYAAPPVGDLRWREPQPAAPWTGIRRSVAYGHDCMQAPGGGEPIQTVSAEDCLYLNVWQPAGTDANAKLPVMVWIHGGGWVGGGSSIAFYDGSEFARSGMVVVSFNYRLGRFGFFAHPALLAAKEGLLGNYGYMDQIAALKWVQNNVAAFGGDPQKVTIVGESAGGGSVLALLTSPQTKGLFRQAMVMSGGGRKALVGRNMTGGTASDPSADMVDAKWAQSQGIKSDDPDALAKLRALPAVKVAGDLNLPKVLDSALECVKKNLLLPKLPCVPEIEGTHMIDGVIVTANPGDIFKNGGAANVPLIIGSTALDLPEHFPPSQDPLSYFGADAAQAAIAYNAPEKLDLKSRLALMLSIATDRTMHEPARYAAREMTAHGNPVWLYRFTYTAESTRPAATGQVHAGELPFLFNMLAAKYGGAITTHDVETAKAFNQYVSNFVKNGDPNGSGLPEWQRFDPAHYDVLNFTLDNGPVFGPDPRAAGIMLVEKVTDAQAP